MMVLPLEDSPLSQYTVPSQFLMVHRSHFGSRYTLGCCGHASLFFVLVQVLQQQIWAILEALDLMCFISCGARHGAGEEKNWRPNDGATS